MKVFSPLRASLKNNQGVGEGSSPREAQGAARPHAPGCPQGLRFPPAPLECPEGTGPIISPCWEECLFSWSRRLCLMQQASGSTACLGALRRLRCPASGPAMGRSLPSTPLPSLPRYPLPGQFCERHLNCEVRGQGRLERKGQEGTVAKRALFLRVVAFPPGSWPLRAPHLLKA